MFDGDYIVTRAQKYLVLLVVLSLLSLSLTQAIVSYSSFDIFVGDESYNTLRLAQEQANTNNYVYDTLQERPVNFSLTTYLLSFINSSQHGLVKTIFLLLGVIATALVFSITKYFTDDDSAFFTTLLFVFNPIYLYYFTSVNETALSFVFIALSTYFLLKNSYVSILFYSLSLLSDLRLALFCLPILSFILYKQEKHVYSQAFIYLISAFYLFSPYVSLRRLFTIEEDLLINFFVYFGDSVGNSLTLLSLAVLGVVFVWERSFEKNLYYLYLITLLVTSLYFSSIRLILLVFMSFFAYKAISYLYVYDWEFNDLKYATLTVMLAGLILSTIVFVDNEQNSDTLDKINAAKELSAYSNGEVISSEENGFIISYFSNNPVLLDKNSYLYDDYENKLELQDEIFYERRSQIALNLLEDNYISYLFIDETMKQGLIWSSENEGLLFVLQFNSTLDLIIEDDFVTVYTTS